MATYKDPDALGIFERAIMRVAPGYGLARAKNRLSAQMLYEAARSKTSKAYSGAWATGDVNVANADAPRLTSLAREAEKNHDLASGAMDVLVNNTVGDGVKPEPQIKMMDGTPAKEINKQVLRAHCQWGERPEVARDYGHARAQRIAARACFRDGEIFAQLITGDSKKIGHRGPVPFSYELIECDYVPFYESNGKDLYNGIRRNAWGEATAYLLKKANPYSRSGPQEYYTIPASNIAHLKHIKRAKQGRGITLFHNVLIRFDELKKYETYESLAAMLAAAVTGVITRETGYEGEITGNNQIGIGPGTIVDGLKPGEDFRIESSKRPSNDLLVYRQSILRAVASGTGAGYSSISKSYDGNYAAQRQELVEQYGAYRALQMEFIDQFEMPIYKRFMLALLATQSIDFSGVDLSTLNDVAYELPQVPWIDPLREVKAYALADDYGYLSKNIITRKLGANPAHVDEQRQDEASNNAEQSETEN